MPNYLNDFLAPPLPREFYARSPTVVAQELLGQVLVRSDAEGTVAGWIVETEAYLSENDPACHASRGRTPRNAAMFGPPGHAYVYTIHARWCMNAVTEGIDSGSAVLIRALEPLQGEEQMQLRRRTEKRLDLTRGPARLCEALAIGREFNGWDLTRGESLWIAAGKVSDEPISAGPRIGISQAMDLPLRFYFTGNRYVSGRRG